MAPQTLHLQAVAGRAAASSQQTSSGSGCHLHRPARLPVQNRARQKIQRFPSQRTLNLAPSTWQNARNRQIKTTFLWISSAHVAHGLEKLTWKISRHPAKMFVCVCLCVCVRVSVCVHQTWSLPMAEPWKRGFHPGLSLIREASLISCRPMLWFICILCHRVMESFLTVYSENPKDVV